MTTIATDGKSMAGDGQACMNGTIIDTASIKVEKLADGSLFGSCGSAADADNLIAFLNAGAQGNWPKRCDSFGAIVVRPDGGVFTCSETDGLVKSRAPLAIGSGMDFAIGAMDAGLDPESAVRIACARDPNSGGKIFVEMLA